MSRVNDIGGANYEYLGASATWQTLTTWTISAWVYPTAGNPNSSPIVTASHNGSRIPFTLQYGSEIASGASNSVTAAFWTSAAWQFTNPVTIALNTWHHVLGQYDGNQLRLYVDGADRQSNTIGALNGNASGALELRVGRRWDSATGNYGFPGAIAEVGVWNNSLYTNADWHWADALSDGASPLQVFKTGVTLMGYWPLAGVGSPEMDFSGNGRHLTLNGAPPQGNHAPVGRNAYWNFT